MHGVEQLADWESGLHYPVAGLLVAGQLAVNFFFVLSGFVLSNQYLGQKSFNKVLIGKIIKRPIRLLGVLVFTMIIGAVLWNYHLFYNNELPMNNPWFSSFWKGDMNWNTFIYDLFLSPFKEGVTYNAPLWTIKFEFYGSLMIFSFLFFFSGWKYRSIVCLAIMIMFYDSDYRAFWLGILLVEGINIGMVDWLKSRSVVLITITIVFVFLSAFPVHLADCSMDDTWYDFLATGKWFRDFYPFVSAGLLFVIVSCWKITTTSRPLKLLGIVSYSLYAIHFIVIGSFSCWLFIELNQSLDYGVSFLITTFSTLVILIPISYIISKYIDGTSISLANRVEKLVGKRVS